MSDTRTRYVYLTHNPPSNVVFSQVVEFIEAMDRHQCHLDLVFMLAGQSFLQFLRGRLPGMDRIRAELGNRVHCLPAPMLNRPVGLAWAALALGRLYPAGRQQHLVIHARNISSACIAAALKGRRSDVRMIFDVRGDKVSEFRFLNSGLPAGRIEQAVRQITAREGDAGRAADHLFCVSTVLKELIVDRTGRSPQAFSVIPCSADETRFRFDPKAREAVRSRLELGDRYVLVYVGGLTRWHCPERLFGVAAELVNRQPDIALLVVTPDQEIARRLASDRLPAGSCQIVGAGREEVSAYLSAGDMGLLLRENDPLNRVASPTKFAEYVLAGLPVMISDQIGDYSDFVNQVGCGIVIPQSANAAALFTAFRGQPAPERTAVAALGRKNFAKESHLPRVLEIYQQLAEN